MMRQSNRTTGWGPQGPSSWDHPDQEPETPSVKAHGGGLPGSPVVKTTLPLQRGMGSIPGQGTKISHEAQSDHEKRKKKTSSLDCAAGAPAHPTPDCSAPLPFFSTPPPPPPLLAAPLPTLAQKPSGPQPLPILCFIYKLFQHGELSGKPGSPQHSDRWSTIEGGQPAGKKKGLISSPKSPKPSWGRFPVSPSSHRPQMALWARPCP